MRLAKAKIGRAAVVLLLAHLCLVLVLPVLDVLLHSHHSDQPTTFLAGFLAGSIGLTGPARQLERGGGLGQAGAFLVQPDHWDCPICFVIKLFGKNLLFTFSALTLVVAFKPFLLNRACVSTNRLFFREHHSRAPPFLAA